MKLAFRKRYRRLAADIAMGLVEPLDWIENNNLVRNQEFWLKKAETTPWLKRRVDPEKVRRYQLI